MVALLLALVVLAAMGFMFILFLGWLVRTHHHASQYRQIVRLQEMSRQQVPAHVNNVQAPSSPQWRVKYKDKGKEKEVTVEGTTEAEALKKFVLSNSIGFGNIISSTRV